MESALSAVRDVTIILYSYGRDSVPFKSRLPGTNITLRRFKSFIHKKGEFRYFFKTIMPEVGLVLEEVYNDNQVLPLYKGMVFGVMEIADSSSDEELNEFIRREMKSGKSNGTGFLYF